MIGKAPIQNFKEAGYCSCSFCYHPGQSLTTNEGKHHIVFPLQEVELRTHVSTDGNLFSDAFNADYHKMEVVVSIISYDNSMIDERG